MPADSSVSVAEGSREKERSAHEREFATRNPEATWL